MSNPELEMARECFLSMIAEARTWRENVDGDIDNDGHTRMYIDYDLNVRHSDLEELANALGIKNAWDETIGDAIKRELALPAGADVPAPAAPGCVLAPVVLLPNTAPHSSGTASEMESNAVRAVTQDDCACTKK